MEYFSSKYDLPKAIYPHNSFWFWADKIILIKSIIIISGDIEDYLDSCGDVEAILVHKVKYAMPYENDLQIFICRNIIRSLKEIWESDKHFE
jgi:hypothetical protein